MKKLVGGRRVLISGLFLVSFSLLVFLLTSEPAGSVTDELAFPLEATYEVRGPDDISSQVHVRMDSWWVWELRVLDGTAGGYISIADEKGRVIAGYEEWPLEEWVVLQEAGSELRPLPNSWLHPYHFVDGDEPGVSQPSTADQVRQNIGLAERDSVRAYRTNNEQTVVYHERTGLPLLVDEPGFSLIVIDVSNSS